MLDFPPLVPDLAGPDARAHTTPNRSGRVVVRGRLPRRDFSQPDTRSGVRFLGWVKRGMGSRGKPNDLHDEFVGLILDLDAKTADVGVDEARVTEVLVSPHPFEELVA